MTPAQETKMLSLHQAVLPSKRTHLKITVPLQNFVFYAWLDMFLPRRNFGGLHILFSSRLMIHGIIRLIYYKL